MTNYFKQTVFKPKKMLFTEIIMFAHWSQLGSDLESFWSPTNIKIKICQNISKGNIQHAITIRKAPKLNQNQSCCFSFFIKAKNVPNVAERATLIKGSIYQERFSGTY